MTKKTLIKGLDPLSSLRDRGLLWSESINHAPNWENNVGSSLVTKFSLSEIDHRLPLSGLPLGYVHEFAFEDKQERGKKLRTPFFLLAWLLARASNDEKIITKNSLENRHLIIWIDSSCWPSPHTLEAAYNSMNWQDDSIFINPKDKQARLWSIVEALRHKCVFAVIANASGLNIQAHRKFLLAAQKGGVLTLLIRSPQELLIPSPAYSRWRVSPTSSQSEFPAWELELKKIKGTLRGKNKAEAPKWNIYWDYSRKKMKSLESDDKNTFNIFSETPRGVQKKRRAKQAT